MLKIIKDSFRITNSYISLATPLIIFSLIVSLYLIFTINGSYISMIMSFVLLFLMLGAFLSGWLYLIKRVVSEPENDRKESLILDFPSGIGEYFLNILALIIIVSLVSIAIFAIVILLGKKYVGMAGISFSDFSNALSNVESMKAFVSSLNEEQLVKINIWNLLLLFGSILSYFIGMFYAPAIFFKKKNPFLAFFAAIKDTFGRKFFKNVALFLFVWIVYFIISLLTGLYGRYIFVHFLLTLVNFYYLTFATILVFNYYYSNFAKIGSEIDTTV